MRFPFQSLYGRLAALIAAVLVTGAVILLVAAFSYARFAANEAYDRLLTGAILQIDETLKVRDGEVSVRPPVSAFETLALSPEARIFYRITGPFGEHLAGDQSLKAENNPLDQITIRDSSYKDFPIRMAVLRRTLTGLATPAQAEIVVAHSLEARDALTLDMTSKATILVLAMSGLAMTAAMVAINRALAPLRIIKSELEARDPKDLSPLSVPAPPEVAPLVNAVDALMGKLSGRLEQMQRFIAAAAHQIRTPLAALSAQVALLPDQSVKTAYAPHLARVRHRTDELTRLTNQLLSQAMVMHRAEASIFTDVDLRDIAVRAMALGLPAAAPADIEASVTEYQEPVMIRGDAISLREAVVNLVHNAAVHGARTRLCIRLGKDEMNGWLEVVDDGPGIDHLTFTALAKPFQDRPNANGKQHGHVSNGTSLGLAIVNDVVKAHDGTMTISCHDAGEFAIRLAIPLVKDQ